jgi:hypothetical protein
VPGSHIRLRRVAAISLGAWTRLLARRLKLYFDATRGGILFQISELDQYGLLRRDLRGLTFWIANGD